jgi:hypothetical protein
MTAGLVNLAPSTNTAPFVQQIHPGAFAASALFAVPPIRAQKLRLDHVEDVSDRGIRC